MSSSERNLTIEAQRRREEKKGALRAPILSFSLCLCISAVNLLLLGGCGFHPLYAESEQAIDEPALATIKVLPIKDRIGQMLEFSLRSSFNPRGVAVEPRYLLTVALTVSRVDLGIQRDATSTRGRVDVSATLRLLNPKDGSPVYTSTTQSTSAFNILNDAYAAEVAEEDARTRTVRDLTEEIRARVALFLRRQQTG
jgi:LPS-assembly lipoprotein